MKYKILFLILVQILTFFIFDYFFFNGLGDIPTHFNFCIKMKNGLINYPANFLFFYLVNLGSNEQFSKYIFILILSVSVTLKFYLSMLYLLSIKTKLQNKWIIFMSFALLFIGSFPTLTFVFNRWMYLGNFSSTVWHNSTIIFLLPFAILLYYLVFYYVGKYKYFFIFTLIILNAIIKPSFLFVLVPTILFYVVYSLYKNKLKFNLQLKMFLFFTFFILGIVFIQKILLFESSDLPTKIVIAPFDAYTKYAPLINFSIALIAGYIFPIVFFIKNKNLFTFDVLLAFLLNLFAILISILFNEAGIRNNHGNFSWQIIPSFFILLLITLGVFIKNFYTLEKKNKIIIILILLGQLFFGIIYFVKCLYLNDIR